MNSITMLSETRSAMIRLVDGLTEEQLLCIPEGWNNNIAWHLGHCLVIQQLLHYKRTDTPVLIPDDLILLFGKGSSPRDWSTAIDFDLIKSLLISLPLRLQDDYSVLSQKPYAGFTTGTGTPLKTFEDALSFNLYHEGMHMGFILALIRLIK